MAGELKVIGSLLIVEEECFMDSEGYSVSTHRNLKIEKSYKSRVLHESFLLSWP